MTKLIGIEEHLLTEEIRAAWAASSMDRKGQADLIAATGNGSLP